MQGTVKNVFNRIMRNELKPVEHFENSVLTSDGKELNIAWHNSVITDNDGNITAALCSGLDITEVSRTNANLRAMIGNTDDFIMITDKNDFPALYNDNYKTIIESLVGIEMKPGIKPHKQLNDKDAIAFRDNPHERVFSGEKFMIEFILEVEGIMRYFTFRFYPILEKGKVVGFTEHSRDITEQKQMEENLRHAEKIRAIGQLAGIMGCADLLNTKLAHDTHIHASAKYP